jgi:hypothetical protein
MAVDEPRACERQRPSARPRLVDHCQSGSGHGRARAGAAGLDPSSLERA